MLSITGRRPVDISEADDMSIRRRLQSNKKWREYTYHEDFRKEYPKIQRVLKRFRTKRSEEQRIATKKYDFRKGELVWITDKLVSSTLTFLFHSLNYL